MTSGPISYFRSPDSLLTIMSHLPPTSFCRRRLPRGFRSLCTSALLALSALPLVAGTKYWDINGATAGAGGATPTGTWNNSTANWSTSSAGDVVTAPWVDGDTAVFSAGSDATGSFN